MKQIILYLFLSLNANATTYYFSNAGNDANAGTSISTPLLTITKLNTLSLTGGDTVMFRCGDTFVGQFGAGASGSSGNPIVFCSYGTGAKPILTQLTTLSTWTSLGSGIYASTFTTTGTTVGMVTINGTPYAMGRFPKTGYKYITSHVTNTSITDANLASSPSYTGGELVLRNKHWVLDRTRITNHSGTTLTYAAASNYTPTDNWGYFIQNHPSTLTQFGDWYWDSVNSRLQMYFGTNTPSSYLVKVSTGNRVLSISGQSYYTFKNLDLQGGENRTINLFNCTGITIDSCNISYSGLNAISANTCTNTAVTNCTLNYTNNNAIDFNNACNNSIVRSNIILNSGSKAGMGTSSTGGYFGVNMYGDYNKVELNTIRNSGYSGIYFSGNYDTIRKNLVDTFCNVKDDGGGIYTWTGSGGTVTTGKEISNNIVLHGFGAIDGTDRVPSAYGIYLDDATSNVSVIYNTAAYNNNGFFLHNSHDVTLIGNVSYNNSSKQLHLQHDAIAPNDSLINITVKRNVLFSEGISQLSLFIYNLTSNTSFISGTIDSNYYSRPRDESTLIQKSVNGTLTSYTLSTYKTAFSSIDQNSSNITSTGQHSRLLYNYSPNTVTYRISQSYKDVQGNIYFSTVILQPYTSIVVLPINNNVGAYIENNRNVF